MKSNTVEVRYEALIQVLEGILERLLVALAIPASRDDLSAMLKAGRRQFHPSAETERQGFVGKWRRGFSREDAATFHRIAGDLLIELGYEPDGRWVEES